MVIEDNIIEYYSDFHGLHSLRDDDESISHGDYDFRICRKIQTIVYNDLMAQAKTDLIHYILDDLFNILDWTYINQSLQDVYFAEKENDVD